MKYEALDRIFIVQTLLNEILVSWMDDGCRNHSGLSKKAIKHLNKATQTSVCCLSSTGRTCF